MSAAAAIQIGLMLAELASAGIDISLAFKTAKDTGKVPQDQWDRIVDSIDDAEHKWKGG